MHNKKCKKVLATVLAGTMVLGMGMTAFASETTPTTSGSTTGAGDFEGHVDKNILTVTLPTSSDTGTFKYIVDPESLIAETNGAKYEGATFESGASVFFQSSENNYTSSSAKLKAINKGAVAADVTVEASVAAGSSVKMAAGKDFTADADKENDLYLGLKVDKEAVKALTETKTGDGVAQDASVTVGLEGKAANYETKYDKTNSKYVYTVKDGIQDEQWNSFEFNLEGVSNTAKTWTASTTLPQVTVTWSYAAHDATKVPTLLPENATEKPAEVAPSISGATEVSDGEGWGYTANFTKGTNLTFTVDYGNKGATSIKSAIIGGTLENMKADANVLSISGDDVTVAGSSWAAANTGVKRYCKITLDDDTEFVIQLTIQ